MAFLLSLLCQCFPPFAKSLTVDLEEDSDRARLVQPSSSTEVQKQTFVVSSEVTHIEERARRMGEIEVEKGERARVGREREEGGSERWGGGGGRKREGEEKREGGGEERERGGRV